VAEVRGSGLDRIDLEPVSSTHADGVTLLRFRVRN
jgi:hypothetical protein